MKNLREMFEGYLMVTVAMMSTLSFLIGNDISGSILMSAVLVSACVLKKR